MSELYELLQSDSSDQYVWSQYVKCRHMLDGSSIEISGRQSHGGHALLSFPISAKSPIPFFNLQWSL